MLLLKLHGMYKGMFEGRNNRVRLKLISIMIGLACTIMLTVGLPACGQPTLSEAQSEEQVLTDDATINVGTDCHDCHGNDETLIAAMSEYTDASGEAVNPHRPVDRLETDPKQTHISSQASLLRCSICHGTHSLPYDPKEPTVKTANVSYCYRACHHQENFRPCWECHEE
jgi:hypothetical protein